MCTSIFWKTASGTFVANNEDIFFDRGLLFTNQRRIAKRALLLPPDIPLQWVSEYGSVIFSHCGKEFPAGGMNEAGLVIEQMTLPETRYPPMDQHPAVNELQIIQYLLDTCDSVKAAISRLRTVRIAQASAPLHYFVVDRLGNSAVVEYLAGQMVLLEGVSLPIHALTNNTYADGLAELAAPELKQSVNPYQRNSLDRFRIAARWAQVSPRSDPIGYAFHALAEAARPDTIWRIVYDLQNLTIYLQTSWNLQTRQITLSRFDFEPSQPSQVYDPHIPGIGSVESQFVPYTTATNLELVKAFFQDERIIKALGLNLPEEILHGFAAYPMQLQPAQDKIPEILRATNVEKIM